MSPRYCDCCGVPARSRARFCGNCGEVLHPIAIPSPAVRPAIAAAACRRSHSWFLMFVLSAIAVFGWMRYLGLNSRGFSHNYSPRLRWSPQLDRPLAPQPVEAEHEHFKLKPTRHFPDDFR